MSVSVSIIVPCYNVAAYLDQCMESLAGQSMEDIEIICVNDGSSDHTAEILREWRDRDGRVRVIDRKTAVFPQRGTAAWKRLRESISAL